MESLTAKSEILFSSITIVTTQAPIMEQGIIAELAMKENTLFFLGKDATVSFFIITYSNHGKISNVAKADIRKANSKYKNAVIC